MSAGAPWSVKGIDPKAREVAKDLARRSGMTLGEWLNSMIMEGDPEEDATVTPLGRRPQPQLGDDRRGRYRRLDDAYGQSTRIPDQAFEEREDEFARVTEAMERLTARLEAAEGRSTLAIGGVNQAVTGLLARLETQERDHSATSARLEHVAEDLRDEHARMLDRVRQVEREAESPRSLEALKALETALGKIANQMYEGDARTRAVLGEVREDVTAVTRRMDRVEAASANATPQAEIQAAVDGVVSRVAERLEQAEARTSGAIRTLESSFTHLDDRLRTAEGRLEGDREARFEKLAEDLSAQVVESRAELIRHFDAAATNAADGRFDQVDRALAALAGHVQTAEKRSAQAIEKMGHEVVRIAQNLNRRMGGVEQSGVQAIERAQGEMARMAQAVENRLRRSDDGHTQALERLGGEIAKISERLSERIAHSERRSALAADDMGERIGRVADKLETRWERASGELAERIRQSEERTARLLEEARESVDRGLGRAEPVTVASPQPDAPSPRMARALAAAAASGASVSAPLATPQASALAYDLAPNLAPGPGPIPVRPWEEPQAAPAFAAEPFAGAHAIPAYEEPASGFPAFPGAAPTADPASEQAAFGARTYDDFFGDEPAAPPPPAPPSAFDDFSGDTEFLAPGEVRPNRPPVSTKEAIQAARAAARLGVRNSSGDEGGALFGGLNRGGGKSKLAERVDKQAKRDGGSTVKKALMASAVAVTLTGAVSYGWITLFTEARSGEQHGLKAAGGDLLVADAGQTPLVAVATAAPTSLDAVKAETVYQDASSRLAEGKPGGVDLLSKAANLGYAPAQYDLSVYYSTGESGLKKDPVEARRWAERAADGGDRRAMYNLGMYAFAGFGGPEDPAQAAKWFRKSAELGMADGQYNLARLYELGAGVGADPAEAYKWYLIASRSGDQESKAAAAAIKPKLALTVRIAAEQAASAFRAQDPEPIGVASR